jgi:hypothetical protein
MLNLLCCANPNPDTIIIVDPKYWYISDNPNDNTVPCCQVSSISENVKHASSPGERLGSRP